MISYLKKYDEAEKEYKKLLELYPHSTIVKYHLAKVLFYKGDYASGLAELANIPDNLKDEQTKLLMADINLQLKNFSEAERLYQEHIQKFPEDTETEIKLAQILAWQKKYQPSIEIYKKLLLKDPDNIQLKRQYGLVLIWMGNFQEGAQELKESLKNNETLK